MDSKKPLYKSMTFWVLVLFLLYSALGFFAVPYFIKKELSKLVINDLNSHLTIDDISFNPYTISINLTQITLKDNNSITWFGADKIHANINLWTTIFNHVSLAKIQVDNPYYLLKTEVIDQNIQFKYPPINSVTNANDEAALIIDIDAIDIIKGSIEYDSNTASKQLNLNIKKITFSHQTFSTFDIDSQFNLSFITDNNDETIIAGSFNYAKSKLDAVWKLNNWSTETIFNLVGDQDNAILGLKNESGFINANGKVLYTSTVNPLPIINIDTLELTDFSNKILTPEHPKISLKKLQINNAEINLNESSIVIESIDTTETEVSLSIDENYNLLSNDSNEIVQNNSDDSSAWLFTVKSIKSDNFKLHLNKLRANTVATNDIDFTSININNLSNKKNQTTQINLSLVSGSEGSIELKGQVTMMPITLNTEILINDTQLNQWQAWIPADVEIKVAEGLISLQQNISYNDGSYTSDGWVKLNNIKLLDKSNQQFISINQLGFEQNHIDSNTHTIRLNNIILNQAQGSIIISEDKQLNLNNLLEKTTQNNTTSSDEDDWIIEIMQVEFIDVKTNLSDKSIQPNYQTELSKVNGIIKGLSSKNLSKAEVNLNGVLDTYGKLKISGKINPLSEKAYTDLSINIENLDLQNFSSYSGKHLGFPINRGKADFELKYKLNQNLLEGVNHLKFKQLKFGDKADSKDAIDLPLKLAVGLLTDSKGIMNINLPVSGNIDDPEFSYGGIVFKAFFKLIAGIVTSPFKLLGKLIPGGADLDLSGIHFQAGTVLLNTGEESKLKAMKKILEQRPGILLELSGVVNTINDKKAIQTKQLLTQLNLDNKPDFSTDSPIKSIKKLYVSVFSDEKWQQLQNNSSQDEITNNTLLAKNAWDELLQNIDTEDKLIILAKNRALYIQLELIENYSIAEDKVFIKPNEMSEELYPQVKFGVGQ